MPGNHRTPRTRLLMSLGGSRSNEGARDVAIDAGDAPARGGGRRRRRAPHREVPVGRDRRRDPDRRCVSGNDGRTGNVRTTRAAPVPNVRARGPRRPKCIRELGEK
ncbi:hypothetical protein GCM10020366_55970 [Saccharopolyspora gregorii]|uniref:Uncharacterized protein n=1 Tax=Saccharopolyspora gregorii TaxID=33914 RepID=A0ABP6RYS9_9PSEU